MSLMYLKSIVIQKSIILGRLMLLVLLKSWKKIGVIFFDVTDVPKVNCHPKVHHFRSSNAISVTEELEEDWSNILTNRFLLTEFRLVI